MRGSSGFALYSRTVRPSTWATSAPVPVASASACSFRVSRSSEASLTFTSSWSHSACSSAASTPAVTPSCPTCTTTERWCPRARSFRRCFPSRLISLLSRRDADLPLRVDVLRIEAHAALEVLQRPGRVAGELVELADEVVGRRAPLVELQRLVQVAHGLDHRDLLVRQGEEPRI